MAYNYQYSKIFTQQGAPVATPVLLDLIGASVPVPVTPTNPLGYVSVDKNLSAIQKYTFTEIWKDGLEVMGLIVPGGGLAGKGTATEKLVVDTEWTDDRYMPSFNFPISQLGDPTDFILPINGSYFSVCYPVGLAIPATAFVEGNGDLRLLHHVTNGEDIRPVYAVWKNYKNTEISAMQITDVVYQPPGLAAGEYIRNVYNASETAMIGELWQGSNFQGHVLIFLNGTMVAKYHRVVRLGMQLFTQLMGSTGFNANDLRIMEAHTVSAAVMPDGLIVVAMTPPPNHISNNAFSSLLVATGRVDANNNLTLNGMANTTAVNTMGAVTVNPALGFIISRAAFTSDPANTDAYYVIPDGWAFASGYTGVSPSTQGSLSGLSPDGRLILSVRNYNAVTRPGGIYTDLKPIMYYLLDPVARKLEPMPDSWGKRLVISPGTGTGINKTGGNIMYAVGHYWVAGSIYQILSDGTRVIHGTPGSADTAHYLNLQRQSATTAFEAASDVMFEAGSNPKWGPFRYLDPITPTPVLPRNLGFFMYDNLITTNKAPQNQQSFSSRVRTRLTGSPAAKDYNIIGTTPGVPPQVVQGYALTNDRTVCNTIRSVPFALVKNNTPYYHTGYWVAGQPHGDRSGKYQLNDLQESSKDYYLDPGIHAVMDDLKQYLPGVEGYSQINTYNWNIIGPYPGVGNQRCIIKYFISYKEPDASQPSGFAYTGLYIGYSLLDCTVTMEADGHARLSWFDYANIDKEPKLHFSAQFNPADITQGLGNTGGICMENADGSWNVHFNIGTNVSSLSETGWSGWEGKILNADAAGNVTSFITSPVTIQRVTWHSVLGLGYVDNIFGLGAFYRFMPILANNGQGDSSRPSRILGSARPAAGFSMTVSAKITVYVNGKLRYIQPQIIDLRDTKADPRWTTFYISAEVTAAEDVALVVSLTPIVDTENRIYIGEVKTSETEIVDMVLEPVTRWEAKRVATEALGSAIIASTGFPGMPGEIVAISAGIDPTQSQGIVAFDLANETVRVDRTGGFFVQDKDMAIARFGNFNQIEVTGAVNKGTVWLNGVAVHSGTYVDKSVINRNDLIKEGWNTISSQYGYMIIQGPFLKRSKQ